MVLSSKALVVQGVYKVMFCLKHSYEGGVGGVVKQGLGGAGGYKVMFC